MPQITKQERLFGENLTTFEDYILDELTKNDDVLAAFKYKRQNNYKTGLYECLDFFDN